MATPDDGAMTRLLQSLLSALGGSLVTLVAFRTKLALMDRRINSRKAEIESVRDDLRRRMERMERRQMITLELVADIARKVGVEGRANDMLIRFLSERDGGETQQPHRRSTDEEEEAR